MKTGVIVIYSSDFLQYTKVFLMQNLDARLSSRRARRLIPQGRKALGKFSSESSKSR